MRKDVRCFLLRWNPLSSSFRQRDFDLFFKVAVFGGEIKEFSWPVRDWRRVRKGDLFFFARVGTDDDRILMKGEFLSKCFLAAADFSETEADGTSRKGKIAKPHMAFLGIHGIFSKNSDALGSKALEAAFGDIDWHRKDGAELLDVATGAALTAYVNGIIDEQEKSCTAHT